MNIVVLGVEVWNGELFVFWSIWCFFDDLFYGFYNVGVVVDI